MARLHHVPLSPFCRKVRLSLAEKKIEVDLVEETLLGGRSRFPEAQPGWQGAGGAIGRQDDVRKCSDL